MKKRLFSIIVIALFFHPWAFCAENGSFLILKPTHFYSAADLSAKRESTNLQKAYTVVDIAFTGKNAVMYKLKVLGDSANASRSGYIVESDTELKEPGLEKVKVFKEIPKLANAQSKFELIPVKQVSVTSRVETSKDFPNVVWRTVTYKYQNSRFYWVPDWSGVYRPDKSVEWLQNTFYKASRRKIKGKLLESILMGLVEPGFTMEQVKLSLGDPIKEQPMVEPKQIEWLYPERRVVFEDQRVLRVL